MTVLVTGGAGYIGSHMVHALVEAGENVVVIDNLSTGFSTYLPEGVPLFIGDVADENLVEGVIQAHGVDAIIHFAGSVVVPESMRDPLSYYRNNTMTSRNLLNAVRIAVDQQSQQKGVMLAMNNQINSARYVTKTHTANVETFNSGDFGLLGEVYPDRVMYANAPVRRQHIPIRADKMPEVEIVAMYGGADGMALRQAVDRGVRGIVVQALGMGNMNMPMFEAVKYALSKNVPVVVSTRVHNGRVLPSYGFVGGGKTTADAGAVMADDLKPAKARILLMLLLQGGVSSQADLQAAFSR